MISLAEAKAAREAAERAVYAAKNEADHEAALEALAVAVKREQEAKAASAAKETRP